MPTYAVEFRTDTHSGVLDMDADTQEHALFLARDLVDSGQAVTRVDFMPYDGIGSVNEIEIIDPVSKNAPSIWQSDDLALRNAAAELRDALQALVERQRADAADSGLTDDEMTWLEDARRALELAKGGAV
jgi:hypothetical protein